MPILLNKNRLLAFIAAFCVAWLDAAVGKPVEALSAVKKTVVLYVPMLRDGAGQSVSPFEVARQLAQASRVPVYGLSEPQLEQGIIGGALLDFSEIGHKTSALAFRVLAGEMPPALTSPDPATNPLVINWRALKKWHVSESGIPGEATVRYRNRSPWERHRELILATAAVVGLQSLLIVGLIVQRSRLKRAERSLRDSEERMSLAAEAANLGMWVWDVVRDEIWMTDKGRTLFGFAPDIRLDHAALIARVHPADRAMREAAAKHAIETQGEYAMEYRVLLPNGTLRWIGARGRCTNIGETKGTRLLGVSMDVTAQKQAEAEALQHREEIAHLSRVAIMGEMAGSLAHELNQPLGAIVSNARAGLRFLERDSLSGEKLGELLRDIAADGRRAGEVIRTIKGMGRKEKDARQLVHLNDVIADVLRLTRSDALAHDCMVLAELHPALPKLEGNLVQLQEVFLNLIVNAFEALKEVPRVRRHVIICTKGDGDGAVLAWVRDFGPGLPAEKPERVFDRFFSTKPEGMGIGLFIARSIVVAHGGTLWAENAEGGGAQFWLRLPASKEIGV
jgi:C4-dicarboxylate-specific signal transduction histidine kinase